MRRGAWTHVCWLQGSTSKGFIARGRAPQWLLRRGRSQRVRIGDAQPTGTESRRSLEKGTGMLAGVRVRNRQRGGGRSQSPFPTDGGTQTLMLSGTKSTSSIRVTGRLAPAPYAGAIRSAGPACRWGVPRSPAGGRTPAASCWPHAIWVMQCLIRALGGRVERCVDGET